MRTYFKQLTFPMEYIPTVFDNYQFIQIIDSNEIMIDAWDTAGAETYDRLRPLSYPDTDILLLCFDVKNRESFNNIRLRWLPEIMHHCKGVCMVLCGLKDDLIGLSIEYVTEDETYQLCQEINALTYIHCSCQEIWENNDDNEWNSVFGKIVELYHQSIQLEPNNNIRRSSSGSMDDVEDSDTDEEVKVIDGNNACCNLL